MQYVDFCSAVQNFFQLETINNYHYDTRFVSIVTDFDMTIYRIEYDANLPISEQWKIIEYWDASLKAKYVGYGDRLGSAVNAMIDHYKKGIFAYDSP